MPSLDRRVVQLPSPTDRNIIIQRKLLSNGTVEQTAIDRRTGRPFEGQSPRIIKPSNNGTPKILS